MRALTCKSSIYFLLFVVASSCINNHKSTTAIDKKSSQEMTSASVIGIYMGNLPCVDCEAIYTVLTLDRDNTYKLSYLYEGKSAEEFVKTGTWKIKKNFLVLSDVDYKYKIGPEYLIQLDLSGQEITGDLAEKYKLTKIK